MSDHSPDVDEIDEVRKMLLKFRLDISDLFIRVLHDLKAKTYSRRDACDLGWAFREIANAADELRKDAKARQTIVGMSLAFDVTTDLMNNPEKMSDPDAMTIRGRFASGTPEVKQQAALPRKNSPEYQELCKELGISEEVTESGIVQFSFTDLADYVTKLMQEGRPLPSGITKTYPVYSTTFRTKKRRKTDG